MTTTTRNEGLLMAIDALNTLLAAARERAMLAEGDLRIVKAESWPLGSLASSRWQLRLIDAERAVKRAWADKDGIACSIDHVRGVMDPQPATTTEGGAL